MPDVTRAAAICLRVRGKDYPMKFASGCKTCKSPYRLEIEHALLIGRSVPSIIQGLPEHHGLVNRNVHDHLKAGHSPADTVVIQTILEQEFEGDIEAAVGSLVSHMGLLKNVVRLVGEGIQEGTVKVNVKEGVAAAGILAQLELAANQDKDDVAGLSHTIQLILEHCRNNMAQPEFDLLMRSIGTDPEIARIRAEYQARQRELTAGAT
jgi:hypothetical protein